jgi:D-lactate dehydrogenase
MRVLVYDAHSYDQTFLDRANGGRHQLVYTSAQLELPSAEMARGFDAVCLFVNDLATAEVCAALGRAGVRLIVQRSTGYNNIDLRAAAAHGLVAMRVRDYSPHSVAEHAVALLLTLNRRVHRAFNRTREFNFRLAGLMGRDLHGQTVGVVGTGKIGAIFARIMAGFGCALLGHDPQPDPSCEALGMRYVELDALLAGADIVSLHVPLTPATRHVIDRRTLALMRAGSTLINTSRGGLVDTEALIEAIADGHLGGVGLDVYEEEAGKFFRDVSDRPMRDEELARLMTFPNVLVTGHQAFFTHEAYTTIAETTIANLDDFEAGRRSPNLLQAD